MSYVASPQTAKPHPDFLPPSLPVQSLVLVVPCQAPFVMALRRVWGPLKGPPHSSKAHLGDLEKAPDDAVVPDTRSGCIAVDGSS